MDTVKVEIITIGDEILIGQIVDTNSAWMAVELNKQGFELAQITSVHDHAAHITEALDNALARAQVVLFTGGLGPTKDDITKQTLCSYFHTELVYNQEVYENIGRLFVTRPNVMNKLTAAQAMVPANCTVIQNKVGTAPIMWFEKDGKVIVSMPGVPYEMKTAMADEVIPRLQQHFRTPGILHKTTIVYGIPESQVAIRITDWENSLPANMHLAYLPNNGIVKLRLSGTGDDKELLEHDMDEQLQGLLPLLGDGIVAHEDLPLEQIAGRHLTANRQTVATAESCTGGMAARLLTSFSGSSAFFKGGVVAYSNEVKMQLLGVQENDLEAFGAVSQQVVEQMANGVRRLLHTDYAIATSGIAGPTGGTPDKPVGTVWIAACSAEKTISQRFQFGSLREQNVQRAAQAAMVMLLRIFKQ